MNYSNTARRVPKFELQFSFTVAAGYGKQRYSLCSGRATEGYLETQHKALRVSGNLRAQQTWNFYTNDESNFLGSST